MLNNVNYYRGVHAIDMTEMVHSVHGSDFEYQSFLIMTHYLQPEN